jgi:hypothetical protein
MTTPAPGAGSGAVLSTLQTFQKEAMAEFDAIKKRITELDAKFATFNAQKSAKGASKPKAEESDDIRKKKDAMREFNKISKNQAKFAKLIAELEAAGCTISKDRDVVNAVSTANNAMKDPKFMDIVLAQEAEKKE